MRTSGRTQSGRVTSVGSKGVAVTGGGLVILLLYALLTGNPSGLWESLMNPGNQSTLSEARKTELTEFVSVVLADTETVWNDIFLEYGEDYREPGMVLFTGSVQSGCGNATSATGPFYCSLDEKIYIDLVFFDELGDRFNAPGDFAMAYVIAHEVGHHVQNQLGILDDVHEIMRKSSQTKANELSVRLELQADYLAGVWAKYVAGYGYLEEGDIDEAMQAAQAVGDDRIQQSSQGYVNPDNFTHGTSEQRMRWFRLGYQYADLDHGDTFNVTTLKNEPACAGFFSGCRA